MSHGNLAFVNATPPLPSHMNSSHRDRAHHAGKCWMTSRYLLKQWLNYKHTHKNDQKIERQKMKLNKVLISSDPGVNKLTISWKP